MRTQPSELPCQFLLSLATGQVIVTLAVARSLASLLTEVGIASEEMFRGDRLPILDFWGGKSQEP